MIEVHGHRGARALLPENTLPAFELAIESGADALELDVVVTRDDQILITHDLALNPKLCLAPNQRGGHRLPSGGPPILIRSLSLSEAQRYDVGSLKHPRFPRQRAIPGTPMPALAELFARIKTHPEAQRIKLNIESKSVPGQPERSPPPERLAELLVGAIERSGLLERCLLQSFDHRTLVAAKLLAPTLITSALNDQSHPDYVAMARAARAEMVSAHQRWLSPEAVQAIHQAGLRVLAWTANTEQEWDALIALEVDGIITDDPAALISYLKARGLR